MMYRTLYSMDSEEYKSLKSEQIVNELIYPVNFEKLFEISNKYFIYDFIHQCAKKIIFHNLDTYLYDYDFFKLPVTLFDLIIPYFPYARQDRVCDGGESFTLKIFANIINRCNLCFR